MRMERKYVIRRRIAMALAFIAWLALYAWLNNLTTPEMCKVPFEDMSQFCLDLLYP